MTFIDWSDSEGMFGLLVEFVADEAKECPANEERKHFLSHLLRDLTSLEQQMAAMEAIQVIDALKGVRDEIAGEFASDPVVDHIEACIEELERVHDDGVA